MQLSVSVTSFLKFGHTYFTFSTNNSQNNDDKAKKPILSSHSISVNYCNIFANFRVTINKVIVALTVLSSGQVSMIDAFPLA